MVSCPLDGQVEAFQELATEARPTLFRAKELVFKPAAEQPVLPELTLEVKTQALAFAEQAVPAPSADPST